MYYDKEILDFFESNPNATLKECAKVIGRNSSRVSHALFRLGIKNPNSAFAKRAPSIRNWIMKYRSERHIDKKQLIHDMSVHYNITERTAKAWIKRLIKLGYMKGSYPQGKRDRFAKYARHHGKMTAEDIMKAELIKIVHGTISINGKVVKPDDYLPFAPDQIEHDELTEIS